MHVLKKVVVAVSVALSSAYPVAAPAQSMQELKAELEALKAHVHKLEAKIEQAGAVDPAEVARLRVKTEAMEDAHEASGLKGLKISGYIDPTYIYNRNASTSSFVFLNNNSSINGSGESFGYDNTYFGSAMLNIDKELESGARMKISLMPSKGTAAGYNFGNLVHEASFSMPLGGLSTRVFVGQIPDWSGYEYIPSTQNKLITHNLLFDFSAANFYTGVGVEFIRAKWNSKVMLGNMNSARIDHRREKTPGLFYRVDYAKGEYTGFGFSGVHSGFDDDSTFGRLDLLEVDGYYTRGAWNFQGQLSYGRQEATAFNGYSTPRQRWYGASTLVSYKVTPRFETVARLDYINNSRGGGGVFGSTFGGICLDRAGLEANCPDGRNGFGSGMLFVDNGMGGEWVVADPLRGTNRSALSLGASYALMPGVSLKGEYRYDRSTGRVFKTSEDQYRRDNSVIGVSTVISF